MLRLVAGGGSMAMNINSTGVVIGNGTADPKCRLDLGAPASSNMILSLFNNTSSYYGFSANNNALQSSSFTDFSWYSGCTNASPINTSIMTLLSSGTLSVTQNLVAGTGLFIKQGFNITGRVGNGIAMHCANSTYSEIFTYDYTASQVKDMRIANTIYISDQNKFVGIGQGTTQPNYPLTVVGNFSTSFIGTYGYLNINGGFSGVATGVVPVTASFQHRLWCSEVNVFSDRRLKENIVDVEQEDAIEFVRKVQAKNYNWKADSSKRRCTGYIAQDVLKHTKFPEVVCFSPDDELEQTFDEDGFMSPAGQRMLVSYQNAVPILHSALANAFDQIDELRAIIETLTNKPTKRVVKKKTI
jgi:hypothetical protein